MIKSCVALAAAVCAALVTPAPGHGQVFLASRPHPDFMIGPLFVVASVSQGIPDVTVNLSWSLTTGPVTRKADMEQDLYLLWPSEIVEGGTAPGRAEPQLIREVEARGLSVVSNGRLVLRRRDRMQLGTTALGEPIAVTPSFVNFTRPGGQTGVVTYIKIPWTPSMADPLSIVTLVLPLKGLIVPKAGTWLEDLFWGRRQVLTTGFGDLGPPVLGLFALYYEHRDRIVHLAPEYSRLFVNFPDADHLRIEQIEPASATRRGSRLRAGTEVVSLPLNTVDAAPQVLKVNYAYYRGVFSWRPVLISIGLLILGNLAGLWMISGEVRRFVRSRLRVGREHAERERTLTPERLADIKPGQSTYDDVARLCGLPDEEHRRVAATERRFLL